MAKKIKTMKLQGKDYAKVAARLMEFREDCPDGIIETSYEFKDGFVIFQSKVTRKEGTANGHAFGKIGEKKAFEKLETIATGRALAFLGYGADGEIASYEEMQNYNSKTEDEKLDKLMDHKVAIDKISRMDALTAYWNDHKGSGKEFDALIKAKKDLLTKKESSENL